MNEYKPLTWTVFGSTVEASEKFSSKWVIRAVFFEGQVKITLSIYCNSDDGSVKRMVSNLNEKLSKLNINSVEDAKTRVEKFRAKFWTAVVDSITVFED